MSSGCGPSFRCSSNKSLAAAQAPVVKMLFAFDKMAAHLTPKGEKL